MFNKILIANRGEIACRIIRTARRMGIQTVAIYSTIDQDSLHVTLADEALCIGEPAANASYLNIEHVIAAAIASKAEAIHPGYGFLSENPDMARACEKAGIVFIGPSVSALETMGSKQLAKQLLEKTSIPLTPGYHGTDQSDKKLLSEAKRIGFPVLLKAANGGGGKGMRTVHDESEFLAELASARRESIACFADDTMLIEKLVMNPRHVEVQIMADHHGQIVHLFDRDCSIQRRHQKIIEEAPAPDLDKKLHQSLTDAAIKVAQAINYRGAGTIEFLVDPPHFYFMEMNTRLQVEHPVTEMITGIDLVEWQIRIAANEPLPCTQDQIKAHGHALECRIYAEDPTLGFIPSIGQVHFLIEPQGEGIRVDSGIRVGSTISMYYDPMVAKIITWGSDRDQALRRMNDALMHDHIGGIKTNIPFLQALIQHPRFISTDLDTHFLQDETIELQQPDARIQLILAGGFDYIEVLSSLHDPLQQDTFAWQMHLKSHWCRRMMINGNVHDWMIHPINSKEFVLQSLGETLNLSVKKTQDGQLIIHDGQHQYKAWIEQHGEKRFLYTEHGVITLEPYAWLPTSNLCEQRNKKLTAPMPATIVAILKNKGDAIKAGERIMVLEAMKMEHTVHAPHDGLLEELFYDIGAQVNEGAELGRIVTP